MVTIALLDRAAVPCGPIHDIEQVFNDPQVDHQDLVMDLPHATLGEVRVTGMPYHFHGTPLSPRLGPPVLGEHSAELLRDLGYSADEVAAILAEGAAVQASLPAPQPA